MSDTVFYKRVLFFSILYELIKGKMYFYIQIQTLI
jgi:hypothetical protein